MLLFYNLLGSGAEASCVAGLWKLSIQLPDSYPLAPPNIHFDTPICHPNVHFEVLHVSSGVCLQAVNLVPDG